MVDFERMKFEATFNRDSERTYALRMAEEFIKTGNDFFKESFKEHNERAKRWEWARIIAEHRCGITYDEYKEQREAYPKFYRVRPQ